MSDETLPPASISATDETLGPEPERPRGVGTSLEGTVLEGRYRIEGLLGRGGMGAVYRATELGITERPVAVKVTLPLGRDVASQAERFRREARAAARLTHPHSLRVFAFGETETGELYLVTEQLVGRSLGDELDSRGALDVGRALRLVIQACGALSEAHGGGMVHRDLKPDNLFLVKAAGTGDFIKVIDFGLASLPDAEQVRLTATGAAIGTPAYMSPEQAQGRPMGPETDIYSMGVILYEMVTGRAPFTGPSAFEVMRAHAMDPPPPLESAGRFIPPALVGVVARCLAKDPQARYPDAAALADALEPIAAELARVSAPAPSPASDPGLSVLGSSASAELVQEVFPPRRGPLILVALVALAVAAAIVWWPSPPAPLPAPTPPAQAAAAPPTPAPAPVAAPSAPAPTPRRGGLAESAPHARRALVPTSPVSVESEPPGAMVVLFDVRRGNTPLTLHVPEGAEWPIRVRRRGYRQQTAKVTATGPVSVVLNRAGRRPEPGPAGPTEVPIDLREFDEDERFLENGL